MLNEALTQAMKEFTDALSEATSAGQSLTAEELIDIEQGFDAMNAQIKTWLDNIRVSRGLQRMGCSICGCRKRRQIFTSEELSSSGPYCPDHEEQFGDDWIPCAVCHVPAEFTLPVQAAMQYFCTKHGGKDYVAKTTDTPPTTENQCKPPKTESSI